MVQYYTLEEVAKILRTTTEKIKEMAKNGEVRPFQDRGNLRFRSQEIDELARAKGFGSDPELRLGETIPLAEGPGPKPASSKTGARSPAPSKSAPPEDADAVFDFTLSSEDSSAVPLAGDPPASAKATPPSSSTRKKTPNPRPSTLKAPPPVASDSDVRLVSDGSDLDFKIADEPPRSAPPSSKKVGSSGGKSKLAPPSRHDSEVHLGPGAPAHDSDVKLAGEPAMESSLAVGQSLGKKPSDSDIRMDHGDLPAPSSRKLRKEVITEEIDLDAEFQRAEEAARSKVVPPPSPRPSKAAQLPTSSPFELSEEDLKMDRPPKSAGPKSPGLKVAGPKSAGPKSAGPKSAGPKSAPPSRQGPPQEDTSEEFTLAPKDESSSESSPLGSSDSGEMPLMLGGDDEVSLGELSGAAGGSGINLQVPADSGISLEQGGSDEIEFELSLDPSDENKSLIEKGDRPGKTGLGKTNLGKGPAAEEAPSDFELSLKEDSDSDSSSDSSSDSEFELTLDGEESVEAAPIVKGDEPGSDSEFELTLDDSGSGSGKLAAEDEAGGLAGDEEQDIFETDFEVPSLEDESSSDSEAMSLESDTDVETSDFDLSAEEAEGVESGSQVVELDDEAAESGAATIKRPSRRAKAAIADEAEVETDAEELLEPQEEEEEEEGTLRTIAVAAPPTEWGPLPALVLLPCVLILFVVGLMGFELIQGMWGYHRGSKLPGLIIDPIARMIDDLPKND